MGRLGVSRGFCAKCHESRVCQENNPTPPPPPRKHDDGTICYVWGMPGGGYAAGNAFGGSILFCRVSFSRSMPFLLCSCNSFGTDGAKSILFAFSGGEEDLPTVFLISWEHGLQRCKSRKLQMGSDLVVRFPFHGQPASVT